MPDFVLLVLQIAKQMPVEPALDMGFLTGSYPSIAKLSNCQMDLGYPEELFRCVDVLRSLCRGARE